MAYYYNGVRLNPNRSFKDDEGNTYAKNWFTTTTEEQRTAVGVTWVDDPVVHYYDQRFYWAADNPKDHTELKTLWVSKTKHTADTLLAPTDWYVVRKAETSTAIPADVTTRRAEIRTLCNTKETAINATADTAALAAYVTGLEYHSWETPAPAEEEEE